MANIEATKFDDKNDSNKERAFIRYDGNFPIGNILKPQTNIINYGQISQIFVAMPFHRNHNTNINGETYFNKIKMNLSEMLLSNNYLTGNDVLRATKGYVNSKHTDRWTFDVLQEFSALNPKFFDETVRKIIKLVFKIDSMPDIPFLKNIDNCFTLSQTQISYLLANAFFCTFPLRHSDHPSRNSSLPLPNINFSQLFNSSERKNVLRLRRIEKLKCLFNYFNRVADPSFSESITGNVTFSLHKLTSLPDWKKSNAQLSCVIVKDRGNIEDQDNMLQVDFANNMVGGGVLGNGCVQEEIRFVINPELIAARLFTTQLTKDSVLIVTGCERFNDYKGYSDTFQFLGNHIDKIKRDEHCRRLTQIVAIDALNFHNETEQFKLDNIERELNKAYCGFKDYREESKDGKPAAIATGNWGCGAFKGNKQLKFLIQLCSASMANRDIVYFTFKNDKDLSKIIQLAHHILKSHCFTVGDVYEIMVNHSKNNNKMEILDYIIDKFGYNLIPNP